MGKKSRRKPAKPPRAPNTPDTAAGDDDWPSPPGADDQNWWTTKVLPEPGTEVEYVFHSKKLHLKDME